MKNTYIEMLERPHLYLRPGNYITTHFICPSAEFLAATFPGMFTDDNLARIITVPK